MVWLHYRGKHSYHNRCEDFYEAYGKRSPSVLWVNPSKLPGFGEKLDSLDEFKPDLGASWPFDLARVGRVLKEQGRPISVRRIRPMGEMLTKLRRAELADLWCSEVFEAYGTSEFGLLATECPDHYGLHLNSDFYIFEVLRGDDDTSPDGEGELVVTSLRELPRHKWRELPESPPHHASPSSPSLGMGGEVVGGAQLQAHWKGGTHPARFKRTREAFKSRSKVKPQWGQ